MNLAIRMYLMTEVTESIFFCFEFRKFGNSDGPGEDGEQL